MGRASRARRVATAAAFGGTGLGAIGAAAAGLMYGESKLARRRIAPAETNPPTADGLWTAPGVQSKRDKLVFAMLGDSSAAGYGVHRDAETPAARIAVGLSALSRRPVELVNVAEVGAQSSALLEQAERVLPRKPALAVVMVGANDVTHLVRASDSVRHLSAAIELLRENNIEVVVGTCPDLGTIRPIAQPLRWMVRRLSRTLAAAQTMAVVGAGGRAVSLGDILGPEFATERHYFSEDQFHPSATGYARAADVLLPSAAAALGLVTVARPAGPFTSDKARPIARAAARAASRPGTEVVGTSVDGVATGRHGRWARLTRRRAGDVITPTPEAAVHDQPATMSDTDR
ncbi:SGNH/GDSL hydrolase family protein [Jatrophihabitans telluris]|uniref:SGNH/GDSL hydrolase family protein n=1 Tax=Jatrophihabitans telluris TaxID=2038343 RepID=A0ABY4R102_9ACTN|nr:SGNH/GDSL hydrolase family protein [Jatrophihabitans telluris]UQX89444.1 SGNH/GDSL hydrolase family protein [Jatrophihabitans telluris]